MVSVVMVCMACAVVARWEALCHSGMACMSCPASVPEGDSSRGPAGPVEEYVFDLDPDHAEYWIGLRPTCTETRECLSLTV
jgi:hypothetical protein